MIYITYFICSNIIDILGTNLYFNPFNYNICSYNSYIEYHCSIFDRALPTSDMQPTHILYKLSHQKFTKLMPTIIECAQENDISNNSFNIISWRSFIIISSLVLINYGAYMS